MEILIRKMSSLDGIGGQVVVEGNAHKDGPAGCFSLHALNYETPPSYHDSRGSVTLSVPHFKRI